MTAVPEGKVFAEKGYLSKPLLMHLWQRGRHWVTGIRRNMKNSLMSMLDTVLLPQPFSIETLFDKLKSSMGLEHTPHRSPSDMLSSTFSFFCQLIPWHNLRSTLAKRTWMT